LETTRFTVIQDIWPRSQQNKQIKMASSNQLWDPPTGPRIPQERPTRREQEKDYHMGPAYNRPQTLYIRHRNGQQQRFVVGTNPSHSAYNPNGQFQQQVMGATNPSTFNTSANSQQQNMYSNHTYSSPGSTASAPVNGLAQAPDMACVHTIPAGPSAFVSQNAGELPHGHSQETVSNGSILAADASSLSEGTTEEANQALYQSQKRCEELEAEVAKLRMERDSLSMDVAGWKQHCGFLSVQVSELLPLQDAVPRLASELGVSRPNDTVEEKLAKIRQRLWYILTTNGDERLAAVRASCRAEVKVWEQISRYWKGQASARYDACMPDTIQSIGNGTSSKTFEDSRVYHILNGSAALQVGTGNTGIDQRANNINQLSAIGSERPQDTSSAAAPAVSSTAQSEAQPQTGPNLNATYNPPTRPQDESRAQTSTEEDADDNSENPAQEEEKEGKGKGKDKEEAGESSEIPTQEGEKKEKKKSKGKEKVYN
jgi:hypothetical protein